jgi:hypothetical protein
MKIIKTARHRISSKRHGGDFVATLLGKRNFAVINGRVAQAFREFCALQSAREDDTTEGFHRGITCVGSVIEIEELKQKVKNPTRKLY